MSDVSNLPIAQLLRAVGPNVVDVGARGGLDEELAAIAWACSAFGFEPEPSEADRLQRTGDPRWKAVRILPYAVGAASGRQTLYVPDSPEGASLRRHDKALAERFGYDNLHVDRREIPVDTVTLDTLRENGTLPRIDYLKLDVEGAELDVLHSASRALQECSAIKVECSFLRQRIDQPLIWEVASFLVGAGFDVADLTGVHRWRRRPVPAHPYRTDYVMPYSRGIPAQCDLLCLRRPEATHDVDNAVMLVVIAAALGHFDHAISVLRARPELIDIVRTAHGLDLEEALQGWSAQAGRFATRDAFWVKLRGLLPQLRSMFGGLPYSKPERPF